MDWTPLEILIIRSAAKAGKGDDSLFDGSVVVALITAAGTVTAAYLAYLGVKKTLEKQRDQASSKGSREEPQAPPDLTSAAGAWVDALGTYGPARNERLTHSRRDLERAIAALDKKKQADIRRLALDLAQCSDPDRAAELREQLVRAGP